MTSTKNILIVCSLVGSSSLCVTGALLPDRVYVQFECGPSDVENMAPKWVLNHHGVDGHWEYPLWQGSNYVDHFRFDDWRRLCQLVSEAHLPSKHFLKYLFGYKQDEPFVRKRCRHLNRYLLHLTDDQMGVLISKIPGSASSEMTSSDLSDLEHETGINNGKDENRIQSDNTGTK